MPLTKDKKKEVIDQIGDLLNSSKMTVVAAYPGTTVQGMQTLRKQAKDNGTTVKVLKNRLVVKALESNDSFKDLDKTVLKGQLLYAFNSEDEVAPAQTLASFAKISPTIEFVGAITADGTFISGDDVKALASLPSKEQLRAQLVGVFKAPLGGFVNVVAGNVRGVLNVLNARAESLES